MTRRARLARLLVCGLAGVAVWAGLASAWFYQDVRRANASQLKRPLPVAALPGAGDRVLVFSPHCDDETLGAGGLMHAAVRRGARVRVVLMTNGDGFQLAAARKYLKLRPSRRTNLRLARDRQRETITAMAKLGVGPEQITFLGYPDRGLAKLWDRNWDPGWPYRSKYTGASRSPYANSYTRRAPYVGSAVLADVTSILRQTRPTWVLYPHPGDDHPDHWATSCFVRLALTDLRLKRRGTADWTQTVKARTYLVHRGAWPTPQGLHPRDPLAPPAALAGLDTDWLTLPLSPDDETAKQRALGQYYSQMAVMRRFLTSFVRPNELLGLTPPALPDALGDGSAGTKLPITIEDALGDTLVREVEGAADLTSLTAVDAGDRLEIRLQTRRPLSKWIAYEVMLRPVGAASESATGRPLDLTLRNGRCDDPRIACQYRGKELRLEIPRERLRGASAVLLGAHTRVGKVTVDRLSWRVLEMSDGPN